MDKFTLNYSMKNVPLPSKKLYLKCLTEKVEKFIKRIRWKAMFYEQNNNLDDDEPQRKQNYGFKTLKCPPQHPDLEQFENELLNLIQNISFKPVHDEFHDERLYLMT